MQLLLKPKVPILWVFLLLIVASGASYFVAHRGNTTIKTEVVPVPTENAVKINRNTAFRFIRPLLFTDYSLEDEKLMPLKKEILGYIESQKSAGNIQSASVYLRKMNSASWMTINPTEEYPVASLFKVPVMISILMTADKDPSFINKKVFYPEYPPGVFQHNVAPLPTNKYYTIRQLLESMVARSDNEAYDLLWKAMDQRNFNKMLFDFQLKPFLIQDTTDYTLSVVDYSRFFRVLYNGGYLSHDRSEIALEVLSHCDYKEGLTRDLPAELVSSRKFGYRVKPDQAALSEFGIFYVGKEPYLLGVMSKGLNYNNLTETLAQISKMVYNASKPNT
jgi:hypothetical protein